MLYGPGTSNPEEEFSSRGPLPPHTHVYGLREFRIRKDGTLTGMVFKKPWTVGVNRAVCLTYNSSGFINSYSETVDPALDAFNIPPDHSMASCKHGFYAYYDGSTNYHQQFTSVGGVIKGSGEVIIGTNGFRVMRAQIMGLAFGEEPTRAQRERVRRRYSNIPIFRTSADLLKAFPLSDKAVEDVPDPDDPFWGVTTV